MDDLLWGYLSQTLINVDAMSCCIFMAPHSADDDVTLFVKGELTRHARETYGAHSFPLAVESDMRMKDVDMLIRTPSRQNWYKAMLKTGIFDLIFRTEENRLKFEKLSQSQRPFTVLEDAGSSVGARNARDLLSNGQDMGQHKINILYLFKTLNITRVERMLNELGVTEHVQGIRKVMQKTVCKIIIGFHVLDYRSGDQQSIKW
jgi:hypothetical protein